ncbi:MAG: amidohydrolase family protein [Betaproteobacteria bacterium]|nr:amidohydrolase family protein [Betaproteobacteria bacterium]
MMSCLRTRFPHLLATAVLLAACTTPSGPAPVADVSRPAVAPFAASTDPGRLLLGTIVTMNAADEVLPGARLWLRDGRIAAVVRAGEALPPGAEAAPVFDTGGIIYPGLIDIHNHPEYAMYPLLPLKRKYQDRYEWRYYDEEYAKRITNPQSFITGARYLNLLTEVGRYGELKALVAGTTALQGMRKDQPYATEGCLVRNTETAGIGAVKVVSQLDMPRDSGEWDGLRKAVNSGPTVMHVAEGGGFRMAREYESLKLSGANGPNLTVIHGVGLGTAEFDEMARQHNRLVWSPLSNFLLYGKTAGIDAARDRKVGLVLAPDWAPSGSKSSLGELKVADLVNRHALAGRISDLELVAMVTRNPADALGWGERLGRIAPGYLADLVVVDARHADPYRNLIDAIEENVRLVTVDGVALYGDAALMKSLRASTDIEDAGLFGGRRAKQIAINCATLPKTDLPTLRRILQQALSTEPALMAERIDRQQVEADAKSCKIALSAPPTAEELRKISQCKFGLPYEPTTLSPLVTSDDGEFFPRLLANPNLPAYLKKLPDYWKK